MLTLSEGVANLDALKAKKVVPSILAKRRAEQYRQEEREKAERERVEQEAALAQAKEAKMEAVAEKKAAAREANPNGDKAGVKVCLLQLPSHLGCLLALSFAPPLTAPRSCLQN